MILKKVYGHDQIFSVQLKKDFRNNRSGRTVQINQKLHVVSIECYTLRYKK